MSHEWQCQCTASTDWDVITVDKNMFQIYKPNSQI